MTRTPATVVECQQDVTSQSITDREGIPRRDDKVDYHADQPHEGTHWVQGNAAYIAPDSPTSGKAIIISVVVPATAKDPDVAAAVQAMLNR